MTEYVARFLIGGVAVSLFAVLGDLLRPKSFAGLFGAAPSVALATLGVALVQHDARYAAVQSRAMIWGSVALLVYSIVVCQLLMRSLECSSGHARRADLLAGPRARAALCGGSGRMIVKVSVSSLKDGRWYEYVVRFVLGGAATVMTGVISSRFGASVGGVFLALPAIFCASATLIQKHEERRKREAGLGGERRGQQAAALDAAGAALGSVGMAAFALAFWLLVERQTLIAFGIALGVWIAMSIAAWWVWRHVRLRRARAGGKSCRCTSNGSA